MKSCPDDVPHGNEWKGSNTMGKYLGMFCLLFLVCGGIIVAIAAATGAPGISAPSWVLAVLIGLIGGALGFAVSVRKDSH